MISAMSMRFYTPPLLDPLLPGNVMSKYLQNYYVTARVCEVEMRFCLCFVVCASFSFESRTVFSVLALM